MLSELLGPSAAPLSGEHWPCGDAHDPESGFRWYYHSHAGQGRRDREHGHFHLFADCGSDEAGDSAVTHLLAIGMDARGLPLRLFTTNRWVSDDRWQPGGRVLALSKRFTLLKPRRWKLIHDWLSGLLRAFRPQLELLLTERDDRIDRLVHAGCRQPLEDRRVTVLSWCPIDLVAQAEGLERAVRPRRHASVVPYSYRRSA